VFRKWLQFNLVSNVIYFVHQFHVRQIQVLHFQATHSKLHHFNWLWIYRSTTSSRSCGFVARLVVQQHVVQQSTRNQNHWRLSLIVFIRRRAASFPPSTANSVFSRWIHCTVYSYLGLRHTDADFQRCRQPWGAWTALCLKPSADTCPPKSQQRANSYCNDVSL